MAGNGETTRPNVEALLSDYIHAQSGKPGSLALPFDKRPSQGQLWAASLAKKHSLDIVLFTTNEKTASYEGIPASAVVTDDFPYDKAVEWAVDNPLICVLWDDEDTTSTEILAACQKFSVQALDLSDGLVEIVPASTLVSTPPHTFPALETILDPIEGVSEEEGEEADEEPEEEEAAEEEDEETYADQIYDAIFTIADLIADLVAERVGDQVKKLLKDRK